MEDQALDSGGAATLRRAILIGVLSAIGWLGACSLTNDLSGITGGPTTTVNVGGGDVGGGGGAEPGCERASECPAPSNGCETAICLSNECGVSALPNGTPLPITEQTAGDCQQVICGADGEPESFNDDTDVLPDTDCAEYDCNSGVASELWASTGAAC